MSKNIRTIINYGTIKKGYLGSYFIVLWITFTYITLQSLEITIENTKFSLILLAVLFILFMTRVAVDYNKSKKLTPNPSSPDQIRKAHDYLRDFDERVSKVYKKNRNDNKYQEYKEAHILMIEYFDRLLKGCGGIQL